MAIEAPGAVMIASTILMIETLVDDILICVPAHLLGHSWALVLEMAFARVTTVLAGSLPVPLSNQSSAEDLAIFVVSSSVSAGSNAVAAYSIAAAICSLGCVEVCSQAEGAEEEVSCLHYD
jgi:hypothetical protein